LPFNCILIRANEHLQTIAKTIGRELPPALLNNMELAKKALEQLWDEPTGQYYSRSFVSHKLIEEPTIATLLPLYAGSINKERAKQLVALLKNRKAFGTRWPVPSVPLNSPDFNPIRYWQGPTWVNTNWLIIDGLERYGFNKEAADLREHTLELVAKSGISEYFNPKTSQPAGAQNFSWTAALVVDLLKT
jgi:glycogen debranching enzyme